MTVSVVFPQVPADLEHVVAAAAIRTWPSASRRRGIVARPGGEYSLAAGTAEDSGGTGIAEELLARAAAADEGGDAAAAVQDLIGPGAADR